MRRLMMAAAAIGVLAGAGSLMMSGAQALPGGVGPQRDIGQIEKVAWVCPRPAWNGFQWVQPPCYRTRPRYIAPLLGPPLLGPPPPPPPVMIVRPRPYYYY